MFEWCPVTRGANAPTGVGSSVGEQAGSGSRRARKALVKRRKSRLAVVHVVQDLVVRAPQKYHAPLTITVNHGSLRSVKNSDRPASICKGAGRGVGHLFICQGEGRGFESRRPLQNPWSERWSIAGRHDVPIICPSLAHHGR